jgi:hypothetical protein
MTPPDIFLPQRLLVAPPLLLALSFRLKLSRTEAEGEDY